MEPAKIIQETRLAVLQEFEQILRKASEKKASDLHLKAGLPPIVRVNGSLYYLVEVNQDPNSRRLTNEQLLNFLFALMNPRQLARYEAGEEVDLAYEIGAGGRFRLNICQQRSNPRIVCRHIPDLILTPKELLLPPAVQNKIATAQRGLILVTGATGSGKSTTLASLIDFIARHRSCHILTIEDPIEFVFKDRKSIVTQREVSLDTRSFSHALKYALRQDPDVILVGEMRDEETVMMALNAAETGHLVLSTLHTVDAPETINRILGIVSEGMQSAVRAQLASVLVGIASQRLVRKSDGKGRVPAVEVLLNNVRVREMISDPLRTSEISKVIEESNSAGMQSFDQSLMWLFKKGQITKEEALLHCTNVRDFQLRLSGIVGGGDWGNQSDLLKEEDRQAQVNAVLSQEAENQSIEIEFGELVADPKAQSGAKDPKDPGDSGK